MRSSSDAREQRFNQLYRDTSDDVLAYLMRRSRTLEDATDALAETYVAAWRKLDSLPTGDRARLWLFGAAKIELRKASGRARADEELIARLAQELNASSYQRVAADEREDELWEALSHLSELDQEILTLAAWEGLAPRQIALITGTSANAIRLRLTRARRRLRKLLETEKCPQPRPAPASGP